MSQTITKTQQKQLNNAWKVCSFDASITLMAEQDSKPQFAMSPAYNGGKLRVSGFAYPVVVELSSARFEKDNIKINANHDRKQIVGHAESQTINAEGIFASGVLSKESDSRDKIIKEHKAGYPHEASIEAAFPPPAFVKAGKSAMVNGRRQDGPFYIARQAIITGIAVVDYGADRDTSVSIAATMNESGDVPSTESTTNSGDNMSAEIKAFCEKHGLDPESVTTAQILEASQKPEQETSIETPTFDIVAEQKKLQEELRATAAKEIEHQNGIKSICAEYGSPTIKVDDVDVSLEAHAINNNWSHDKVTLEAMRFKMDTLGSGGVAIHDATSRDADWEVIECALAISSGLSTEEIEKQNLYASEVLNKAEEKRFKGYRPSMAAHVMMRQAGVHCQPGRLDDEYVRCAIKASQIVGNKFNNPSMQLSASGFTTVSLPGIMSNVVNKRLLAAYNRVPSIVPYCFGRESAPDFKPTYSYQFEGLGMLERLGKDGEIKHGRVMETEYTKKVETYAKMLAWTRQHMINDDLNALGRTADLLGVMAYKAREYAAVQMLLDPAYWTDGTNSFTGNPFGVPGLTTAVQNMMNLTDGDGLPISVEGNRILTASALSVLLNQVINDTEIRIDGSSAQETYFIRNPHVGNYEGYATAWLNNATVNPNGDRDTTWYLFADPSVTPGFSVIYLNGSDSPMVESDDTDFNTLGMQFRSVFDFGFGANDPRYAQRNFAA